MRKERERRGEEREKKEKNRRRGEIENRREEREKGRGGDVCYFYIFPHDIYLASTLLLGFWQITWRWERCKYDTDQVLMDRRKCYIQPPGHQGSGLSSGPRTRSGWGEVHTLPVGAYQGR